MTPQDTSLNYIKLQPHNMRALLIQEALRWVGTYEDAGNNKGQDIVRFLRAVSIEEDAPWCMAFVQYCLDRVKAQATCLDMYAPVSKVHRSGHCLTVWQNTPLANRVDLINVVPGDIIIWRKRGTDSGHTGIIIKNNNVGTLTTIEGNSSGGVEIEREGDCVGIHSRLAAGYGVHEVCGFIRPWL